MDANDERANEVKALARDYAELAITTLADVARDYKAKDSARVMAAKTLLERGFGAPERKVEQKVDVTVVDQRAAHLAALQRLAGKNPQLVIEDKSNIEDADWTEGDRNGNKSKKA